MTVTPAGTSAELTRDASGTFSGKVSVPAGPQTVTAPAWAGTTAAGSGSGSITVIKGMSTR